MNPTTSPSLASLLNPASPPHSQPHCPPSPQQHQPYPPNSVHFLTSASPSPPSTLDHHAPPPSPASSRQPKRSRILDPPLPTNPPNPNPASSTTHPVRPLPRPVTSGDAATNSFMPPPLRAASASAPYPFPNTNSDALAYRSATNSLGLASSPTLLVKPLPPPRFPPNPNLSLRSVSHPFLGSPGIAPHTRLPASPSHPSAPHHTQSAPPAASSSSSPSAHSSPLVPSSAELPPHSPLAPALNRSREAQQRSASLPNNTHQASRVTLHEPGRPPRSARPSSVESFDQPSPKINHTIPREAAVLMPSQLASEPKQHQHGLCPPEALEESIFGIGPYDEFSAEIGRFIWRLAKPYYENNEGHLIEIEAKLGTLSPRGNSCEISQGGERMFFPIGSEAPLITNEGTWFQTNMTLKQHKTFNDLLNERFMETKGTGYLGVKIDYSHTKQVDEFYDLDDDQKIVNNNGRKNNKGNKVRVSRCQQTGEIKSVIIKEKLGSLDISSPRQLFDYRVSVNVERPIAPPLPEARPSYRRYKDRLSYAHQICQVDLTQVKFDETNAGLQHELEVEFKDAKSLLDSASRWNDGHGDPAFLSYLEVWLNTVKLLNRNASSE